MPRIALVAALAALFIGHLSFLAAAERHEEGWYHTVSEALSGKYSTEDLKHVDLYAAVHNDMFAPIHMKPSSQDGAQSVTIQVNGRNLTFTASEGESGRSSKTD